MMASDCQTLSKLAELRFAHARDWVGAGAGRSCARSSPLPATIIRVEYAQQGSLRDAGCELQ